MSIPDILTGTAPPHPGLNLNSLDSLLMNGQKGWRASIGDNLTSADISFKIDGTATVKLGIEDEHRTLLQSPLTQQASVVTIDGVRFVLCGVEKQGPALDLTFEHAVPNSLRLHTDQVLVAPGTMSRVDFVKKLAAAESWIQVVPPIGYVGPVSNVQMSVGDPTSNAQTPTTVNGPPPSYWDAMGTVLTDIGWRRFSRGSNQLIVAPDTWLYLAAAVYDLSESSPGVDSIDFTYDSNTPTTDATVTLRCEAWSFPVGLAVNLVGVGIASGKHLVTGIDRDLLSPTATVTCSLPTPTIPEPPAQDTSTSTDATTQQLLESLGLPVNGQPTSVSPQAASAIEKFIAFAQSKVGGPYLWGGNGPDGYDCSGLVQAAAASIGVKLPRYSVDQYNACVLAGGKLDVSDGIKTRGALLFHNTPEQHVAISLGNGQTIEAMNSRVGIVNGNAGGRGWTDAATLPLSM